MYIFYTQKMELNIFIKIFIFIPFTSSTIRHCIYSWPGIHNDHVLRARIGSDYTIQHLFIFHTPCTET
uniref:Putative secreted protein n=1 Tax=Panstrongylus lignarius TaxID=156445 RepID=A0A224Y5B1_9HEMI